VCFPLSSYVFLKTPLLFSKKGVYGYLEGPRLLMFPYALSGDEDPDLIFVPSSKQRRAMVHTVLRGRTLENQRSHFSVRNKATSCLKSSCNGVERHRLFCKWCLVLFPVFFSVYAAMDRALVHVHNDSEFCDMEHFVPYPCIVLRSSPPPIPIFHRCVDISWGGVKLVHTSSILFYFLLQDDC
jgi:hypothetical protein